MTKCSFSIFENKFDILALLFDTEEYRLDSSRYDDDVNYAKLSIVSIIVLRSFLKSTCFVRVESPESEKAVQRV